jgi:hypothetical protein
MIRNMEVLICYNGGWDGGDMKGYVPAECETVGIHARLPNKTGLQIETLAYF